MVNFENTLCYKLKSKYYMLATFCVLYSSTNLYLWFLKVPYKKDYLIFKKRLFQAMSVLFYSSLATELQLQAMKHLFLNHKMQ